jgi:hypothetical protein
MKLLICILLFILFLSLPSCGVLKQRFSLKKTFINTMLVPCVQEAKEDKQCTSPQNIKSEQNDISI